MEAYVENVPEGSASGAMDKLYQGQNPILRGQKRSDVTAFAYGAQFVEVRVHRPTCEIRVPRMLGAFAAGTIVNPMAAHSQYMGGMIWGMSSALLEETEIDLRAARYVNDNLSEYLVAGERRRAPSGGDDAARGGYRGEPDGHQGPWRDRYRRR